MLDEISRSVGTWSERVTAGRWVIDNRVIAAIAIMAGLPETGAAVESVTGVRIAEVAIG